MKIIALIALAFFIKAASATENKRPQQCAAILNLSSESMEWNHENEENPEFQAKILTQSGWKVVPAIKIPTGRGILVQMTESQCNYSASFSLKSASDQSFTTVSARNRVYNDVIGTACDFDRSQILPVISIIMPNGPGVEVNGEDIRIDSSFAVVVRDCSFFSEKDYAIVD